LRRSFERDIVGPVNQTIQPQDFNLEQTNKQRVTTDEIQSITK
jgi:hypothetical protein